MDVSRWHDAAAIESWLAAQARRADAALDLAEMALALAALAQPGKSAAPHAAHLAALVGEATALARPRMPPAAQAAVIEAVLFDRRGYRGDDETYDDIVSGAMEVKARGALIIGVSPQPNEAFDYHIPVADVGAATAIVNAVPAQLLGYYLALLRGHDPDKPRNLAKSVTVK